eukprot:710358-Pelagomonas_calceolata.AAC.1
MGIWRVIGSARLHNLAAISVSVSTARLVAGPQFNAHADPPPCRAHSSYFNHCRALTTSA